VISRTIGQVRGSVELMWPGTESNRRRQPFQGCALPTELPGRDESLILTNRFSRFVRERGSSGPLLRAGKRIALGGEFLDHLKLNRSFRRRILLREVSTDLRRAEGATQIGEVFGSRLEGAAIKTLYGSHGQKVRPRPVSSRQKLLVSVFFTDSNLIEGQAGRKAAGLGRPRGRRSSALAFSRAR
jgi:hypothetical protein